MDSNALDVLSEHTLLLTVLRKHPTPWRVADEYKNHDGPSAIVDANRKEVVGSSEWTWLDFDVAELIVALVNRHRA